MVTPTDRPPLRGAQAARLMRMGLGKTQGRRDRIFQQMIEFE